MVCRHCSSTLPENATFCDACGARVVAAPTEDLFLGRTLLNQYIIKKKLGEGGFGAVYEAEQPSVGRKAAVKTLHRHLSYDSQMVERFRREGLAASRLKHPSAVQIYNSGATEDGILWIAMEFLEGQTLEARLRQEGPLSPEELLEVLGPVCEVLEEAHEQGIVHRDLKPENIMLGTLRGKKFFPKLLDFGIAGLLHDNERMTHTGIVSGTPPYMAPEQWKGLKHVDARTDIYALGVIAYQALSGKLPFEADTNPNWMYMHCFTEPIDLGEAMGGRPISPAIRAVIHKALAKEPSERYQTATAFQEALTAALRDPAMILAETIPPGKPAAPPGPTKPGTPPSAPTVPFSGNEPEQATPEAAKPEEEKKRLPWAALALVALLAVGLTLGGLYMFGVFDSKPESSSPPLPPPPATTLTAESPATVPTTSVVATLPASTETLPATLPTPPPPSGECPSGATKKKGKCVCTRAGEELSADGTRCVPRKAPPESPPEPKCPSGAVLEGGKCVCTRAGEVLSADGTRCIPEAPEPPASGLDINAARAIVNGARERISTTCRAFGTGSAKVTLKIEPSGVVSSIKTDGSALSACAGGIVRKLEFPAFSGGSVSLSFTFTVE